MAEELFHIQSESPAAPDMMFWQIAGHESLSRPSAYELWVLSDRPDIRAGEVLGHSFSIAIDFAFDGNQHFRCCQGHAVRFIRSGTVGRYFKYRVQLRSWFWLLTKRTNSRILQDETVLQIMNTVFDDSPIKGVKKTTTDNVIGTHLPRRYCVQFNENDYTFLSRLLEDEGIYYWFDAHDAPGTMYLTDASGVAHKKLPATSTLYYRPVGSEARHNQITHWNTTRHFETGKHAARDRDFKNIRTRVGADIDATDVHELADFETFEFAGGYFDNARAEDVAKIRADELTSRRERHWGLSDWPDITAGRTFELRDGPEGTNGEYLIGACTFFVSHPGHEGVDPVEKPEDLLPVWDELLDNDTVDVDDADAIRAWLYDHPGMRGSLRGASVFAFTALPAELDYRPPRLIPRVAMPGPQSALVVGPEGQELHVDEFGRVKVQFHWDRYGQNNEQSTCWVRVSQPWAGQNWGGYFAPRIGQEVIVDFLNGDPDRPVIVGRVYNDDQPIPYKSPTHSGFKTRSTPGGVPTNFNELRFEDRKGGEQVFIHAERRMDVRVKRNKYETVQGASNTGIGGAHALTSGATLDLAVGKEWFARAEGKIDLGTSNNLTVGVDGQSIHHAKSKHEVNARSITLEALTSIALKVGGSFIEVSPLGVSIEGPLVRINCYGSVQSTEALFLEDPLYAVGADTGEPGYLDRLPRGGGGGGRHARTSNGYHARPVVRQNDGSYTYAGNGICVQGSPDFVDATLKTLASLDGTPTGHQLIDNLQTNGHTVTIAQDYTAAAGGGGGLCRFGVPDSLPAGESVPITQPDGSIITLVSDGSGSDSTVYWMPGNNGSYYEPDGTVHYQPDEALLGHELNHADHAARGQSLINHQDPADPTDNLEEARTIGVHGYENEPVTENNILRDMGENWRRIDHGGGAVPAP
jgi:uncharacterized protein involved in type VI secretion and phage assembly